MMTFIYKSGRKDEMYLYLREKDEFDVVPDELRRAFGKAEFVMSVDLSARERLAREDIEVVKNHLQKQGYHLQMPPAPEAMKQQNTP